eukprot:TRINITY_DN533_c1_g3_i2.p1 TRINITY_DN533_c1_g3~~TRINITY_DN533_c1_g3_i2.p1  ORF type:complete len:835 (+),score=185.00 TRINITY_DN533_c1_g3_i2:81-2585(+)
MRRAFITAVALLLANIAAASEPVRLVWVDGDDKLVIDDEAIHELVGRGDQLSDVTVIGGYSKGTGLSTMFNAFMIDDRASATLQGFPMRTSLANKRQPSVWIQRTGKKTETGSEIILLSCESCSIRTQTSGSVTVASRLFHFVQHLSHHLLYHTAIPGHNKIEHLELLLHQSQMTEFSKVISETTEVVTDNSKDVIHLSTPVSDVRTPITWVWSGDEHTHSYFMKCLKEMKDEGADLGEINGFALSQIMPDNKMLLLDDMSRCQNTDLEEAFKADVEALFAGVTSNIRPWKATVSSIWNYAKSLIKTINNNEQPARLPKADQIVQASISDRKMYSLALYRDLLLKVSEGDAEWLRVLDIADSSQPRNLLESTASSARRGSGPFLQTLEAVSSSRSSFSGPAPCTFQDIKSSEARAWDFSLKFFTSAFKEIKEAQSETTSLRKDLTKIRDSHRERHLEKVTNYMKELDELISESIGNYYSKAGYEQICSAAFEKKAHDELQMGLSAIYATAKEWWPGYDEVPKAEEKARSAVTNRYDQRIAEGNKLLEGKLAAANEQAISDFKLRCSYIAGTPTKTSSLRSSCNAARQTADNLIASAAKMIPEGECRGTWVTDTTLFMKSSKELTAALNEIETSVMEKNYAILQKMMNEVQSSVLMDAEAELSVISSMECPDEDQLDNKASELMSLMQSKLSGSWSSYDNKICAETIAVGIDKLKQLVVETKDKIENKLFGSEEAREWRQEWITQIDERIANCPLCPYSSYVLRSQFEITAEETAPTSISGEQLSPGFRRGLIAKGVKMALRETKHTAYYEPIVLGVVAILIASLLGLVVRCKFM